MHECDPAIELLPLVRLQGPRQCTHRAIRDRAVVARHLLDARRRDPAPYPSTRSFATSPSHPLCSTCLIVTMETKEGQRFFEEESPQDVRRKPTRFAGYSIGYKRVGGPSLARLGANCSRRVSAAQELPGRPRGPSLGRETHRRVSAGPVRAIHPHPTAASQHPSRREPGTTRSRFRAGADFCTPAAEANRKTVQGQGE